MNRHMLPIIIAAAALGIAGCAPSPAGSSAPASTSSTPAAGAPMDALGTDAGAPADGSWPEVEGSSDAGFIRPAKFGETVTFPGGVEMTVKKADLRPIVEADMVQHEPGDTVLTFEVEVANKTAKRLDSSMLNWPSITCLENDSPSCGELISNSGVEALFPGETRTAKYERMIPASEAGSLRISIADPDMLGPDAIWEGSAK